MKLLHYPVTPSGLPQLEAELLERLNNHHQYFEALIQQQPAAFLPFATWMQHALYAPDIGYYSGGSTKFGSALPEGDFTTAPELTPLFGQTVALQIAQVLQQTGSVQLIEFGAGSGAWAAAIIPALLEQGIQVQYQILEVSASLRHRQQERLAAFADHVTWLDTLPESITGVVIANEVLDAMPAHLVMRDEQLGLLEIGVTLAQANADQPRLHSPFQWAAQSIQHAHLATLAEARLPQVPLYQSEINLAAELWVQELGSRLQKGAIFLFDYGFPQHEYYHTQRAEGTLMCHFRHHAHEEALLLPGLQDITTHVDFTAIADAALATNLDVLGYTSQARFLLNCGIANLLHSPPESDDPKAVAQWGHTVGAVQKLLSEAEMGELFKVMALSKDIAPPLIGFSSGDRRDRL